MKSRCLEKRGQRGRQGIRTALGLTSITPARGEKGRQATPRQAP